MTPRRLRSKACDRALAHAPRCSGQNDIANSSIAFVNLAGYRLYRRLGMQVRVETAGSTLARANEKLIVVRGRFAGRLTLGSYCAVTTVAQN